MHEKFKKRLDRLETEKKLEFEHATERVWTSSEALEYFIEPLRRTVNFMIDRQRYLQSCQQDSTHQIKTVGMPSDRGNGGASL